MAWAKPVGVFDRPVPGSTQRTRMPVDVLAGNTFGQGRGQLRISAPSGSPDSSTPVWPGCRLTSPHRDVGPRRAG